MWCEGEKERFIKNFSSRLEELQRNTLEHPCVKCRRNKKCSAGEPVANFMVILASHLGITAGLVRNKGPGHVLRLPENRRSFSKRIVAMSICTAFGGYMADYIAEQPNNLAETMIGTVLSLLNREGLDWERVKEACDYAKDFIE